jgi:hypothetical protein
MLSHTDGLKDRHDEAILQKRLKSYKIYRAGNFSQKHECKKTLVRSSSKWKNNYTCIIKKQDFMILTE